MLGPRVEGIHVHVSIGQYGANGWGIAVGGGYLLGGGWGRGNCGCLLGETEGRDLSGFSAHWVRVVADKERTATAQFHYT